MKLRFTAFSLIELMVVIAIVAVLAAVATPAYKSYINKSKYTLAYSGLMSIADKANSFYMETGDGPTSVAEVGLTPDVSSPNATPESATEQDFPMPPYISYITIGLTPHSPGQCQAIQTAGYVHVDAPYENLSVLNYFVLSNVAVDVNGVMENLCYYYPADGVSDAQFPGKCVNAITNWSEYENQLAAFDAQC